MTLPHLIKMDYDPLYKSILLPKEFLDNANALLNKKPLNYYVRIFLGFLNHLPIYLRKRPFIYYVSKKPGG